MLVVAQIFKAQLSRKQLSTIRYMSLTMIYLTSSFEMIAAWAADDHLWEMVVLGIFALLGITCGVFWKIPQFVYLGLTFLVVTLVSMVISVIYVGGELNKIAMFAAVILLGILILVGIMARDKFEYKIKELIERVESWD